MNLRFSISTPLAVIALLVSHNLFAQLTGVKTIGGTSPDYATLAAAVTDLNSNGVGSGGVTFNIRDGAQTGGVAITATGTASNPIKFQSQSLDASLVTISHASSDVITLTGCSYITFNELTIDYTGSSSVSAIEIQDNSDNVTISNCVLSGSSSTGTTFAASAIYASESSSALDCDNFVIAQSTITNGAYGIYFDMSTSAPGGFSVQGCEFVDNAAGGIRLSEMGAPSITGNSIYRGTTNNTYYGVYLNGCTGQTQVTQNYIYTTGSGVIAYGINLLGSGGSSGSNATIANNSIQVTNGASPAYGIDQNSTSKYWNVYSNTLYVSGGSSSSSFCYRTFTSSDDTKLKNNVFIHEGTNTGSTANQTIYIANSGSIGEIDYNCYYTVNTGTPFRGRWPSTNYTSFGTWTTATGEANSVNIDPVMSFTSGIGWKATANALTGDGTNLGLTQDVDGTNRQTPTTIGAHENGAGTSPNIIVSVTSLTQFVTSVGTPSAAQTYTVEGQNLTANITITAPTNWQVKQQGVGSFGSSVTLTQSGGTVATTTIEARYNPGSAGSHSGNITHTSTGATQKDVAVTGVSSNCSGNFTGTYTINSGLPASCTNYKSFSDVVSDLLYGTRVDDPNYFNGPGIDGPVTFNVNNGTYNEQLEITEVSGASATNTITFKSATGVITNVTLQAASSGTIADNYTIDLNGADYITFRDMTIKRTGSNTYANVVQMHGDASNNKFINNSIEGRTGSASESAALVWAAESNTGNSDNSFEDNHFLNGSAGIWYEGASSNLKPNINITGNTFENYRYGLYLMYLEDVTINDNTFINAASYNTASTQGIYAFHVDKLLNIRGNQIYLNRGTNVYGMELLSCIGDNSHIGTISNNMVAVGSSQSETSSGAGDGTGTTQGIYMNGTTYKNFQYNSWLTTSTNPTTARAFYVNGPSPNGNINLKNNIFAATGGGYCFYNSLSSGTILSSDYNDFYSTGGSLFAYWGSAAANLTALQGNSGMDANSVSADPVFTSNTDLHASGTGVDGYGNPIGGITVDIDGQPRDATTPDIGADEIDVCVSPTVDTDPSNSTICAGANTTFSVVASGTSLTYQWRVNTGSGYLNVSNTGVYSNATTDELTITGATAGMEGYTYVCVVTGFCGSPVTSAAATLHVNTLPAIGTQPINSSISAGGNTSFTVAATGTGIGYQWQVNTGSGFSNITNGGVYGNATTATLNITGATLVMSGYTYQCVVSGTCTPSVTSSSASLTVTIPLLTWNGSIDTDWFKQLNWTPNQVPTSTDNISISNVLNDPVINGNGATCGSVTIVTGATVTVNSGYTWAILGDITANGNSILGTGTTSIQATGTSTLTGGIKVSGVISVASGSTLATNGGLTLENGASLMHGTGTPGAGGSITGNITVKRIGTTNPFVYNMWSTPVVGGVLPGSNKYVYVPSNGTHSSLDDNPGPDPGWSTNVGATMTAAKGYISTNGGTASFTGLPNNGNKTLGIATSLNPLNSLTQGSKFNLVGNPYPSAITANDLISGNSGIIAGSLYFWDDDLSGGSGYSSSDYAVWNGIGAVGGGGHIPNGKIGSCQGFIIEALSNNNITFANSMRSANNSQFFKTQAPEDYLKVYVGFETATKFNEILVAFAPDATEGRDVMYDAYKVGVLAELSLSAVQEQDEFAIVAFPDDNLQRVVPLHLRVGSDGNGTFMLTRSENLGSNQVYLYDQLLNVMHNITADTSYACNYTVGDAFDRFFLYFNSTITGQDEIKNGISAYVWNKTLFISSLGKLEGECNLSIYDMLGREVYTNSRLDLSKGNVSLSLGDLSAGAYLVRINGEKIDYSNKFMVQ